MSNDGAQPSTSGVNTKSNDGDDLFARPELPKELSYQEYIEQDEIYRLRKVMRHRFFILKGFVVPNKLCLFLRYIYLLVIC